MAGLRYLLDSNILSEPSRPRPDAGVQSRLRSASPRGLYRGSDSARTALRAGPYAARGAQAAVDPLPGPGFAPAPGDSSIRSRSCTLACRGARTIDLSGAHASLRGWPNRRDCTDERRDLDHPQHRRLCRFCQSESGELVRVTAQQEWKRFACNEGSSELGSPSSHAMPLTPVRGTIGRKINGLPPSQE